MWLAQLRCTWVIKFLVWITVYRVRKQLVHVQHKIHFQRTQHFTHRFRWPIIMVPLYSLQTHFNERRAILSPDVQTNRTYWKTKVISFELSQFSQFQIAGNMREKFIQTSFLHVFAGLFFSLSTVVLLTSFLDRPLLRAKRNLSIRRSFLCSCRSPLVFKNQFRIGSV